jgi:hypothetical protein
LTRPLTLAQSSLQLLLLRSCVPPNLHPRAQPARIKAPWTCQAMDSCCLKPLGIIQMSSWTKVARSLVHKLMQLGSDGESTQKECLFRMACLMTWWFVLADQARDIFEQLFLEHFGKKHLSSNTLRCATFVKALMHRTDLAKILACSDRSPPFLSFCPCTSRVALFCLPFPIGMSVLKYPPNRAQHRRGGPRKDGSRLRCHAPQHQDARRHGVLLILVSKPCALT